MSTLFKPRARFFRMNQNFLVEMDGWVAKYGLFATRLLGAADPIAAEHPSVQMIRETQRLRDLIRNELGDPPVMDVKSIVELESIEEIDDRRGDRRPRTELRVVRGEAPALVAVLEAVDGERDVSLRGYLYHQ